MTFPSAFLILTTLIAFIAGQLLLKHAMAGGFRKGAWHFVLGLAAMTFSFFVTLGLLQKFDLSYLFPLQGFSVVIISLLAAAILRERLTVRLLCGAALISAGVVLVSLS